MASRGEARCPCEADFKHFGNKNGRFYRKTYHFCVIARPQSGRGNLKAEGMASRGEAREHETTKSPNFGSSRSDTTSALLRKRHFTRAQARISRAQYLSHDHRSYFTAKPYSLARRTTFTAQPCRASFRDTVSFRQRLPRRAQKCALLAMTQLVGFSGKRNGFQNETFEKRCGASPRKKAA